MFQFPGCPLTTRVSAHPADGRVAPFGDGGLSAWLRLPHPIAALQRPSSACRAEASSNRASCLAWSPVSSAARTFRADTRAPAPPGCPTPRVDFHTCLLIQNELVRCASAWPGLLTCDAWPLSAGQVVDRPRSRPVVHRCLRECGIAESLCSLERR